MIFKPKETNTMCLSTKLNLADKTIGKWLTINELDGIKWEPSDQLKKVVKTESDLGVDYKGEYKSTFSKLN